MNKRSNTSIQMIADYEGDVTNLFNVHIEGEIPILATRNMAFITLLSSVAVTG
jgi:ATP-dependent Lon protease